VGALRILAVQRKDDPTTDIATVWKSLCRGIFFRTYRWSIGDLMLDRYMFGSVSRISPEAPVPVLEIEDEQARLRRPRRNVEIISAVLSQTALMLGVVEKRFSGLILKIFSRSRNFRPMALSPIREADDSKDARDRREPGKCPIGS